jgi:SAM-dependent methyltransferase
VNFKDHFSGLASAYARHRPKYPPELAAHLAAIAPSRSLALDLATGNGQAAIDLAMHFDRVLASDASARQLAEAVAHPRVFYLRHPAERLPIRSASADLIAVAQAAHWLDFDRFYAEARRVLRPGGVVALWTYFPLTESPAPAFEMAVRWSLTDVINYLGTWSAVDRYRSDRGEDPLLTIAGSLASLWPGGAARAVRWPIYLRTGSF